MVFDIDNKKVAKIFHPDQFQLFRCYHIYCYYDVDDNQRVIEDKIYVNDNDIGVGDFIQLKEGTFIVEYKYVQQKSYTQLIVKKVRISYEVI